MLLKYSGKMKRMFFKSVEYVLIVCLPAVVSSCLLYGQPTDSKSKEVVSCHENMPARFAANNSTIANYSSASNAPSHLDMQLITGGEFVMGAIRPPVD